MRWRSVVVAWGLVSPAACGSAPELLQGDAYLPDASGRPNALRADACDGGLCDAGTTTLPVDASAAPPTNVCAEARAIGTVSGDTGAATVSASGTCSEWLSLRVSEDEALESQRGVSVRVTLTSIGTNFDLYAFVDPSADVPACAAPSAQATSSALEPETVVLTWGAGAQSTVRDESRTVSLAVLKTAPPCGDDAGSYSLLAEGNRP